MSQEGIKVLIRPSDKQRMFFSQPLKSFNILSGVTRSGKTYAQAMRFHKYMQLEAPKKSLHLMSGRTSESLYDNLIRPIIQLDQHRRVKINARKTLMRYDDKEIRLVGCDNELATDRIQGKGVASWWADEIVKHPKSFVEMAISRCTWGGKPAPKVWTCNPDHPSHFIKADYIDNDKIDKENWYFGFGDNRSLSDELVNELKASFSGPFYDRMILGKWTVSEGVVYDRFDRSLHMVDNIPQRLIVEYGLGIDWGYSEALAITLYAIDNDRRLYQIDEFKEKGRNIDHALIEELGLRGWWKLPIEWYNGIDWERTTVKPSIAYADSNRPEYIEMFTRLSGVPCHGVVKGTKPEMIQAVQRRYNKSADGTYGMVYLKGKCDRTLSEKDGYRWKQGAKGDEVVKENDHLQDAEQYFCWMFDRHKVRFVNTRK